MPCQTGLINRHLIDTDFFNVILIMNVALFSLLPFFCNYHFLFCAGSGNEFMHDIFVYLGLFARLRASVF